MNADKFLSCKGSFILVEYTSTSDKPSAQHKGVVLSKEVRVVCRAGIDFANLQSVKDGIAMGERGGVQGLPWGVWECFPYTIAHDGQTYYRLYPSPAKNHKPTVRYLVNGAEVTRDDYLAYLTPSARAKAGQPRECFNVKAVNCRFPDAIPADAEGDEGATEYPAVA